ncbi:hypothetical protein CHUAL_001007 [Chamberlinius hualienensis]
MAFNVRGINGESHHFSISGGETVAELKRFVAERLGVNAEEQLLFNCGKPLDDDCLLLSENVIENSTVDVSVRVRGG